MRMLLTARMLLVGVLVWATTRAAVAQFHSDLGYLMDRPLLLQGTDVGLTLGSLLSRMESAERNVLSLLGQMVQVQTSVSKLQVGALSLAGNLTEMQGELQTAKASSDLTFQQVFAETANLQALSSGLEANVTIVASAADTANAAAAAVASGLSTLNVTTSAALQNLDSDLLPRILALESANATVQIAMTNLDVIVMSDAALYAAQFAALQENNISTQASVSQLMDRVAENEDIIKQLQSSNSSITSRVDASERTISALQSSNVSVQVAAANLAARLNVDEQAITALQAANSSAVAATVALAQRVSSDEQAIAALQAANSSAVAATVALAQRVGSDEQTITALQAANSSAVAATTALVTRVSYDELAIAALQQANVSTVATFVTLSTQLVTYNLYAVALSSVLSTVQLEAAASASALAGLTHSLSSLFTNLLINGDMSVDQRYAARAPISLFASTAYLADRSVTWTRRSRSMRGLAQQRPKHRSGCTVRSEGTWDLTRVWMRCSAHVCALVSLQLALFGFQGIDRGSA